MKKLNNKSFLIIGAGNMGFAFIYSLVNHKFSYKNITVLEKNPSKKILELKKKKKITLIKKDDELGYKFKPDLVLIAVKPNDLENIFSNKFSSLIKNSVILSIVAGKKTTVLRKLSKQKTNVVRAMTNTPVSVGMGSSIIFLDNKVGLKAKNLSKQFLELVGQVMETTKESQIDTFTAIFGSGPAYIYYFIETLSKIAMKNGFKKSDQMVIHLFLGSMLLMINNEEHPTTLREKVTSKGGTTDSAIKSLMTSNNFYNILEKAIIRAKKRSKELN